MMQVKVEGLRELQAELKKAGSKLPRELTKAHKKVARTVMVEAQQVMTLQPIPKSAEAAAGLKAAAGQKWAGVKLASDNPFVRAAEFGTVTHSVFGRTVLAGSMKRRVWQPWRGNGEDAGYALYPVLRDYLRSPRFEDEYFDALDQVYAKAFPQGDF